MSISISTVFFGDFPFAGGTPIDGGSDGVTLESLLPMDSARSDETWERPLVSTMLTGAKNREQWTP